jgi:hypothetical protein
MTDLEQTSGGAAVSAAPTKQTAFFRGCICLSCTNKANGIHVLGWCTSWLVHFLIGALLDWCTSWLVHLRQVHPLEGTLTICVHLKSVGEHRCLRYLTTDLSD